MLVIIMLPLHAPLMLNHLVVALQMQVQGNNSHKFGKFLISLILNMKVFVPLAKNVKKMGKTGHFKRHVDI